MKLVVDKDICIGCGACAAICPDVFEIDEDGLAVSVVDEVNEEVMEDAIDAKEGCPVNAIKEDVAEDTTDEQEDNEEEKENNQEN